MPFHRWYKWLEKKFDDLRQAFLDEAEQKVIDLENWNVIEGDTIEKPIKDT